MLATFYLSILIVPLGLWLLWISPFVFLCLVVVSLVADTTLTVLKSKVSRIEVICSIPFVLVLNTVATAVGFYIGVAKYAVSRARQITILGCGLNS
jgi:hypothetical protein